MKQQPIYVKTRTGLEVELRSAVADEAQMMIDYLKTVCDETPFLLSDAEDVNYTAEGETEFLKNMEESGNSLMLNAYVDGSLAGNSSFQPVSSANRMRHRASMGIAVFQNYSGQGIGEVLIDQMLRRAGECGFEIMELDVYSSNERAIHLYEKLGFRKCGTLENAVKYKDGSYTDLILMQKKL